MVQEPATGPSPLRYSRLEPATCASEVYKRGKLTKTRKTRHLSLGENVFTLRRKAGGPVVWSVDARSCIVSICTDIENAFEICCSGSVYTFETSSSAERDNWIAESQAAGRSLTDFYSVGKTVGRGSFAEVSLAADKITGELFAVKCIIRKSGNERQIESLRREMEIITSVHHTNVVATVDIFHSPTHIYIVMEYVNGGELFDIIAEARTFQEKDAMQVMREILLGLEYLHEKGIVHRDIKPENILCVEKTWPLRVKLCDFGLSNVFEADKMLTSLVGTCVYRAPEMFQTQGHSSAVDLWAAGVVLYVMLFGLFPFFGQTDAELAAEIDQGLQYPSDGSTVTKECTSVLEGLLEVKADLRLTAGEALQLPWFTQPLNPASQLSAKLSKQRQSIHSARRSDLSSVLNSSSVL